MPSDLPHVPARAAAPSAAARPDLRLLIGGLVICGLSLLPPLWWVATVGVLTTGASLWPARSETAEGAPTRRRYARPLGGLSAVCIVGAMLIGATAENASEDGTTPFDGLATVFGLAGVALLLAWGACALESSQQTSRRRAAEDRGAQPMQRATFLGGHNVPLAAGSPVLVHFTAEGLGIGDPTGRRLGNLPYARVTHCEVQGAGKSTTSGGFIGGGFGVQGAVEGMLIASALNALTSKTTNDTHLVLTTGDAQAVFTMHDATPRNLQVLLAPLHVLLRQRAIPAQPTATPAPQPIAPTAPHTSTPAPPLEQLERLAALYREGLLTEAEFRHQKELLLAAPKAGAEPDA